MYMVDCWPWRMLCHQDRVVWWMLCHRWLLRVWRMLCRYFSTLADTLPPWSCYLVDASPPSRASSLLSLASLATIFCAGPALRVAFVWVACVESPPPPCFLCCLPVVLVATAVCVLVCTFSSVFLLSLVLCVLVLAKSCLAAKSLCL